MSIVTRFLDSVAERIEHAEVLDPLAERLTQWSAPLYQERHVRDLASGTPLGHPLHPLLVALPIGSWSAAMVFDGLGDEVAARRLVGFGTLTAVPTALSGLSDWADTVGGERRVGLVHALVNGAVVGLYAASWVARRRPSQRLGIALSLGGATLLGVSGWLGGHLVYALGVGVDTTAFQEAPEEWTDAAAEDDIRTGSLFGAEVAGVPVVLTRSSSGAIVAYADRCTHRGGPLHEGELVDGCIQCPWHGSQFSVADGSVVRGPATRPQPPYDVRVDGGRVQLRRTDEPRSLRTNPIGH